MALLNAKKVEAIPMKKEGDFHDSVAHVDVYGENYICPEDAEGFTLVLDTTEAGTLTIYAGESIFAGGNKETRIYSERTSVLYFDTAPYVVTVDGEKRIYFTSDFSANVFAILR